MRDLLSRLTVKRAHSPYYYSGDNVWISEIIDMQGYDALCFAIQTGALVDSNATFTTLMQESDNADFSSASNVDDTDMVSMTDGTVAETAASFQFDDDDDVKSIGYIGSKRYVRLYITAAGNTGVALLSVLAIQNRTNQAIPNA